MQVLQAQKSISDFFNDERLRMILEQIVTNFMLLTSEVLKREREGGGGREREREREER